ncbi:MAG: diadenylate cyclase CdaA [Desulfobacterales bacterium]|jgi:uncharacterized protein (TIGR00159 family)
MNIIAIVRHIRPQDVLDILFITVVVYYLYIWFRSTKAFKALIGLLALGIIFTAAQTWGLFLTTWMFQILWQVLIILLIILFQPEIRQFLERFNPFQRLSWRRSSNPAVWVEMLTDACFKLSKTKTGVLVVIERNDWVDEWITGGIPLEGQPTPEILMSVFQKESPLHDGAMIIRKGRIVETACYLPLSSKEGLPKEYGTRHRAALGVVERCDAWAVVVSEERGKVSLVRDGLIGSIEDPADLVKALNELMTPKERKDQKPWHRLQVKVLHQWRLKLITLALVTVGWIFLAGQQNFIVSFKVPVEMENLPDKMEIVEPIKPEITITARGLRKDASTLSARNVRVKIDLSVADHGVRNFRVSRNKITLPSKNVDIIRIEPDEILFVLRKKESSNSTQK